MYHKRIRYNSKTLCGAEVQREQTKTSWIYVDCPECWQIRVDKVNGFKKEPVKVVEKPKRVYKTKTKKKDKELLTPDMVKLRKFWRDK
jgi:hypothetical protein